MLAFIQEHIKLIVVSIGFTIVGFLLLKRNMIEESFASDFWHRGKLVDSREFIEYKNTDFGIQLEYYNNWDVIKFRNGYGRQAPEFIIELKGISVYYGHKEWGAVLNKAYFVLHLGEIL